MKFKILVLLGCFALSGTVWATGVATQLRSPNDLSRSPVIRWKKFRLLSQQDSMEASIPTIDKSFFKSLLIPGWGQFSKKKYLKTGIFLGVEAAVFTGYFVYNSKYHSQLDVSHKFAEEHWSAERWLGPGGFDPGSDPSSHKIMMRCGEDETEYPVPQQNGEETVIPPDIATCANPQVVWNGESYENVYKYDEFAMGWDTYDPNNPDNTITVDKNKYYINPNRLKNKHQREKANNYAEVATFFIYGIIGNHVVSAFDALFFDNPKQERASSTKFSMKYAPRRIENNLYSAIDFQWEW